jgi:hypothetical protein
VDVVDAGHAHPLGDCAEADAVALLAGVGRVAGQVQVEDHVILPGPLRHRLDRRVADEEVDHHDDRAQLLREVLAQSGLEATQATEFALDRGTHGVREHRDLAGD